MQSSKIVLDNSEQNAVSDIIGLPTIDIVNSNINNGTAWKATVVASCTVGALYYDHIRTPNTTTLHVLDIFASIEHSTVGGSIISLYKSPATHTITAATGTGTAATPINFNFSDTANTTTMKIFAGSTYESSLAAANLVESHVSNLYAPSVHIGRYVLAANENYTLKYQSIASNTTAHINYEWYAV